MRTRKIIAMAATLAMVVGSIFTGCGSTEPADLTGNWSGDDGMTATISGEDIRVYWDSDGTRALYWAGSYVAPTEPGDYSWESAAYTDETESALLASGDASKTFTYSGGKLSFDLTMMGVTSTIKLEKVEAGDKATAETTDDSQEEAAKDDADYHVEVVDNAIVMDYVTDDKSELGLYVCVYLKNPTEDKVFTGVQYQYTVKRESDGSVIDTTDLFCSYIAPGDTGIAIGQIVLSRDDVEDLGDEDFEFIDGKVQDADAVEIVPQSDFEVTGISAQKSGLWMEFKGQVTNNSTIDVSTGAGIVLIAKKDGEPVAAVEGMLDTLKVGGTVSFNLSGTDDMDGDYDVYIDYLVF